jgi:signal transduction histidine kinase
MKNAPQFNDILLYTTAEGKVKIEVLFENETFWLSQKKISDLLRYEIPTINYHLKVVFKNNELAKGSVKRKILLTVIKVKALQTFFITKPTGQGLGLSLAYDIVAKGHGGVPIAKGIRWKV